MQPNPEIDLAQKQETMGWQNLYRSITETPGRLTGTDQHGGAGVDNAIIKSMKPKGNPNGNQPTGKGKKYHNVRNL